MCCAGPQCIWSGIRYLLAASYYRPLDREEKRGGRKRGVPGLCWEWRLSSQRDSMAPLKKGKKPKRKPRDRSKLSEKSNPHSELKGGDTEWWYAFWHKNGGATGTLETSSRFFFSSLHLSIFNPRDFSVQTLVTLR